METITEVGTSSMPLIAVVLVGTSTPPTQIVVAIAPTQSDEEDEVRNLISSLSKFLEKKKSIKSIEKTLTTILDKMEKIVSPVDTSIDIQQCATILCKAFDDEFTTLMDVATIQAQTEHEGKLLKTMCTNMRNDIETLNICIKKLRKCIEEGK